MLLFGDHSLQVLDAGTVSYFNSLLNTAIQSSPGENKPQNIKQSYLSLFLHLSTKIAIFLRLREKSVIV